MRFPALGEFVQYLESIGELKRISAKVDPYLEVTEIATRALRENKPALLFENVQGSKYPLAMNVYASERRIELALGRHPQHIGEEFISFFDQMMPPKPSALWKNRAFVRRLLKAKARECFIWILTASHRDAKSQRTSYPDMLACRWWKIYYARPGVHVRSC